MKLVYKSVFFLAAGIVLLAVVSAITPNTVRAAIATLVQNVDEPGRNPFQATVPIFPGASGCSNIICNITVLSSVPTGQRLVITNLTGAIAVFSGNVLRATLSNGSGAKIVNLPFSIVSTGGLITSTMFSVPMQMVFEAGDPVQLDIIGTGGASFLSTTFNMLISGFYIKL
jgi:hypothetical protein